MTQISQDQPAVRRAKARRASATPRIAPIRSGKQGSFTRPLKRRRQPSSMTVLLVAAFGAFLAFLDSTIVNVAFPSIQSAFPTQTIGNLSWVLNAYNIVFAAFLVAAGKLADLLGRKRVFIYGVVIFTAASGLCAIAQTLDQLVAFRIVQGLGAALLVPASLALVVEGFDAARRAHGVGLWGAAAALASGLGPPIGGVIVEASNWRWAFLVNLPLGVVAVVAAKRRLVESRASGPRRAPDLRGTVLLAAALGLLTLGLIKGPDWGWSSLETLGSFLAAAVALAGFVLTSRSHPAPLVEPALLRIRSFVAGNVLTVMASVGFYGYLLTHVLFLHYVWGYSLVRTGLAVAPAALVATVVAAVLGRLADRHGHRMIAMLGALIWAGSLVWYLQCAGTAPDFVGDWLPGQLLQGIGVGATLPVLGSATLSGLAAGGNYATASAVASSLRQLGAVIGVALLVVLIGTPDPGAAEETLRRGWTMAAVCFLAVAIGAIFLGRTRHDAGAVVESDQASAAPRDGLTPRSAASLVQTCTRTDNLIGSAPGSPGRSPLFTGPELVALADRLERCDEVEIQAGLYLFHEGDAPDYLYVVGEGRLQVLREESVIAEAGRGEVVGELGVLLDAPRSASVRAVRDSTLVRLTKAQFDQIADRGCLGTLLRRLACRLHQAPPPARTRPAMPATVVAVVGLDMGAPVTMVAAELVRALSTHLGAIDPGRVDRYGLERAEASADKVVLHAASDDADWREFCLRVADRIVLVARDPMLSPGPLPNRAGGADLVLAGPSAAREQRCTWEELTTPRSVHTVRADHCVEDLRPLAARIAGRSIGLVLGGGGARAFAHLGVLEELETAGVVVDRFAGTSVGAIIAALAASGLDAAGVDAYIYEYFIRTNPIRDYTIGGKGLIRGRRTLVALHEAYGGQLIEELPNEFRCVSVDLLSRQTIVHRRGLLADAVACSLRLPGLYPPHSHGGRLHVDGGVLDNLPVSALSSTEGPLIAVNVSLGGDARPSATTHRSPSVRVPGLAVTLLRTMTMAGDLAAAEALARADVAVRPDTRGVGLLEFGQIDRAREAGRAATREAMPQIIAVLDHQRSMGDHAL